MEKVKPILYIDVDGVLFGLYGEPECLQLRPGVLSFLKWAQEHFVCKWLTCWPEDALRRLFSSMYGEQTTFPEYVPFHDLAKQKRVPDRKTAGIDYEAPEWFWIEDGILGSELHELRERGCAQRYIHVEYLGADALERVRQVLAERLAALETTNKEAHS